VTDTAGYTGVTPEGAGYTGAAPAGSASGPPADVVGYTGITVDGGGYSGVTPAASSATSSTPVAGYTGITVDGGGYSGIAPVSASVAPAEPRPDAYSGVTDTSPVLITPSSAASTDESGGRTKLAGIERYEGWFGSFDAQALARDLTGSIKEGDTSRVAEVVETLELLEQIDGNYTGRLANVARELASITPLEELASLADSHDGQRAALGMVRALQTGYTTQAEAKAVDTLRSTALPRHDRLSKVPWSRDGRITARLQDTGSKLQSIDPDGAEIVYDEYRVSFDQMPPGVEPGEFLGELARDLNGAVNDGVFDTINEFKRRDTGGPPTVGDVYDIEIVADSGSVMLVEQKSGSFVFQTITTPFAETGLHPENGIREFGFEQLQDGKTVFYTRGVSQPRGMARVGAPVGAMVQDTGWRSLIRGIGNELVSRGGRLSPKAFEARTTSK
jgi:hypothetical protein